MAKRTTSPPHTTAVKPAPKPKASGTIRCWATDPGDALPLRTVPAPKLSNAKLDIRIGAGQLAPPQVYNPGTAEFRYWAAAETLRRAADFWIEAGCKEWQSTIGKTLAVELTSHEEPNAYYDRSAGGLVFCYFQTNDADHPGRPRTVYFGDSPDILAHELGHAILDAVRPDMWDIETAEYGAFHEAFGDISALLVALQVPEAREALIAQTHGSLWLNSSISRLAEEIGQALWVTSPQYTDSNCLRNLSTHWTYQDPTKLKPEGSNATLTSEPHNFSRVFSGAFLHAVGHMAVALAAPGAVTSAHIQQASADSAGLLLTAARAAPLRTQIFQAVAEQLVIAAGKHPSYGPAYVRAITTAMVRYGLLSSPVPPPDNRAMRSFAHAVAYSAVGTDDNGVAHKDATRPVPVSLLNNMFGLTHGLLANGPALNDKQDHRSMGVLPSSNDLAIGNDRGEVQHYVENLARQGRIKVEESTSDPESFLHIIQSEHFTTHLLEKSKDDESLTLRRIRTSCGCGHH